MPNSAERPPPRRKKAAGITALECGGYRRFLFLLSEMRRLRGRATPNERKEKERKRR